MQAVCQFNSALSTIRHDVALLVRSAAVGFDSLSREMVAVLEAVWSEKMPVKWSQGVCSEALSLKDGMTGTLDHDLHHYFTKQELVKFRMYRISLNSRCRQIVASLLHPKWKEKTANKKKQ